MKKLISLILMLAMLCCAAQAVPAEGAHMLDLNAQNEIDMDGDGAPETIRLELEGSDGEEYIALYLFGADGSFYSYDLFALYLLDAWCADLNGDGLLELMVECDFYSDDYAAFCFNYTEDAGMTVLPFTGLDRTEITDAYTDAGYGKITAVNGNRITLTGSQDVLGTWMASREFDLIDGRFELVEGMFMIDIAQSDWTDRPLILKQDIDVGEGNQAIPLKKGDLILPVASDLKSFVLMTTESGRTFQFDIQLNEEYGWGWIVNGINEDDLFEYVPYAD